MLSYHKVKGEGDGEDREGGSRGRDEVGVRWQMLGYAFPLRIYLAGNLFFDPISVACAWA